MKGMAIELKGTLGFEPRSIPTFRWGILPFELRSWVEPPKELDVGDLRKRYKPPPLVLIFLQPVKEEHLAERIRLLLRAIIHLNQLGRKKPPF